MTELLVIGAGPAGIAAATRAAEAGMRATVVDNNPAPGGQIWRGERGGAWLKRFEKSGARLERREAFDRERAARVILATGARELFLPFPGWTEKGVMGAAALQAMMKGGLDVRGKRVVIAGSGPLLMVVAKLARTQGARVSVVAEQAEWRALATLAAHPAKMARGALLWRPGYRTSTWVERVEEKCAVMNNGARFEFDWLGVGYGLVPNTELAELYGCACDEVGVVVDAMQRTSVDGVWAAGELTGIGGVELSLVEGEIAGLAAAGLEQEAFKLFERRARWKRFAWRLSRAFALRDEVKRLADDATVLCRCEGVSVGAARGCADGREAKLLARVGMGACQGRVCGAAARAMWGWRLGNVRMPASPARVGELLKEGDAT